MVVLSTLSVYHRNLILLLNLSSSIDFFLKTVSLILNVLSTTPSVNKVMIRFPFATYVSH